MNLIPRADLSFPVSYLYLFNLCPLNLLADSLRVSSRFISPLSDLVQRVNWV